MPYLDSVQITNIDESSSSYSFLTYFLIIAVVSVALYLVYHNKAKVSIFYFNSMGNLSCKF